MLLLMPERHHSAPQLHLISTTVALACAALVALAGGLTTPAAAFAAGTCPLTAMTSSSQPICWQPFVASSPINTPIPANPKLAADSQAVISRFESSGVAFDGSTTSFSFAPASAGTRPVFFATPSDPVMTLSCKNDAGPGSCTGENGVSLGGVKINVPPGAVPFDNSDAHMTVIETATGNEYDMWDASESGSTIDAGTGAMVNVNTGSGLGSSGDDAALGLSAGLVRPSELAAGTINHALVVTVPCVDGSGTSGYVWPSEAGWGSPCGPPGSAANNGAPAMGQLIVLNMTTAQIQASGAPAWQQTIMTALARYGAYVEDTGGGNGIEIIAQSSSSFTDVGAPDPWAQLALQDGYANSTFTSSVPIPDSDLEIVDPCVPEGLCPPASVPTPAAPVVLPSPVAPAPPPTSGPAPQQTHQRTRPKPQPRAHKHDRHRHDHKHHKHHRHHHRRRHHQHHPHRGRN
jgi:hypothetical protein